MSDSAKIDTAREELCAEHVKDQNLSFRVVYPCAWMSSKEIDAIERAFLAGWDSRDREVNLLNVEGAAILAEQRQLRAENDRLKDELEKL